VQAVDVATLITDVAGGIKKEIQQELQSNSRELSRRMVEDNRTLYRDMSDMVDRRMRADRGVLVAAPARQPSQAPPREEQENKGLAASVKTLAGEIMSQIQRGFDISPLHPHLQLG
jgi:hypothetical protein